MLTLLCLIACAHPPVLSPVPLDAPVKKVSTTVRYGFAKTGLFSLKRAGPDTLVTSWTAPPGNGGSAVTGYDVRSKKDGAVAQTDAVGANVFTVRWVIAGVSPGQTASLNACVNAKNAAGAGQERCSAPVSYTAIDVVPLPPGSVTSIVVKLP